MSNFFIEVNRFPDADANAGPGFARLPSAARMAFAQELYLVLLTSDELDNVSVELPEEYHKMIDVTETVEPVVLDPLSPPPPPPYD